MIIVKHIFIILNEITLLQITNNHHSWKLILMRISKQMSTISYFNNKKLFYLVLALNIILLDLSNIH